MINPTYIVKIYLDDKFVGYLKSYRLHRSAKYRFEKTLNVGKAIKFSPEDVCKRAVFKLENYLDKLRYCNSNYHFDSSELTNQELRSSKLRRLNVVVIKEGIFKNKKPE